MIHGIYSLIKNNKKFYPYNNIILFNDSEELIELKDAMYLYAVENQVELEVLYEDDIEAALNYINDDEFSNVVVVLTRNEEVKKIFEENVKEKILYINENPFKEEVAKIYNYFE